MEPSPAHASLLEAGWTERFVAANGVRLHTVQAGSADAPLVLLLHGFPEFWYSWRHQIAALSGLYHVVAPDLRGYNLSDKPEHGYDLATLAADVRALIYALGQREAAVVGHDWGGIIAWATAVRAPDVVRRLVILNAPHPATLRREVGNLRQVMRSSYIGFFQLRGIAERAIERDGYAMIWRTFRAADRARAWLTDDDIRRYVEAIARPGAVTAALAYYRQLVRPSTLQALSPMRIIRAPTLVLWGARDPYLGIELTDGLERWVRNLRVERFPEAGHWLNQQEPQRANRELLAFLA